MGHTNMKTEWGWGEGGDGGGDPTAEQVPREPRTLICVLRLTDASSVLNVE